MSTRQVTIAFESPVDIRTIAAILQAVFKDKNINIGYGYMVNGIHENWILVEDE
jgi:hypothetical protein